MLKLMGPNADLLVHVDVDDRMVHAGTGVISKPGDVDNLLGAEAYVVPVSPKDGGQSRGWFVVQKGWGGCDQLKYDTRFEIENSRFTDVRPINNSRAAWDWVSENLCPMIFGGRGHDILAELGFGTNPAVSDEYLMGAGRWSIAVAEKKRESSGGRTVHLAHGNSKGMGGTNDVPIHQDFLVRNVQEIKFNYQP